MAQFFEEPEQAIAGGKRNACVVLFKKVSHRKSEKIVIVAWYIFFLFQISKNIQIENLSTLTKFMYSSFLVF